MWFHVHLAVIITWINGGGPSIAVRIILAASPAAVAGARFPRALAQSVFTVRVPFQYVDVLTRLRENKTKGMRY